MPKTKKTPVAMTPAEWQVHRLTHLPYNAACRCCVAEVWQIAASDADLPLSLGVSGKDGKTVSRTGRPPADFRVCPSKCSVEAGPGQGWGVNIAPAQHKSCLSIRVRSEKGTGLKGRAPRVIILAAQADHESADAVQAEVAPVGGEFGAAEDAAAK